MWIILLFCLLAAGTIHGWYRARANWPDFAELLLVYLLAGYCGVAQIALGLAALLAPADWLAAHMSRIQPGDPMVTWVAYMLIGMGAIATLSIWLRGSFLIAPVLGWSIFWLGATYAHSAHDPTDSHPLTLAGFVEIFASHGLVAILLLGFALSVWTANLVPRDGLKMKRWSLWAIVIASLATLTVFALKLALALHTGTICLGDHCADYSHPHDGFKMIVLLYCLFAATGVAGLRLAMREWRATDWGKK